ncbi:ion channel [Lysobacter niabensis]|uniref:ion channel n=1 Tax=Agrilutibacter niabensis TaxID=380628 RepID=UPI00360ABABA
MLRYLLTGVPVILLCLILQAIFVSACLRRYAKYRYAQGPDNSAMADILLLCMVMLLTLVGNCVQIAIWAGLFMLLGEFGSFSAAFYHSCVNFVTLGYGDIVMSERWRLLGPLEGANGILMFGISTAVMTAAVMDVIKTSVAAWQRSDGANG